MHHFHKSTITTNSDPLIWTKSNVLSSDFCNHVIDKFENDDRKHQGLVGYKRQTSTIKKSMDLNISSCSDWKDEDNIFYNSLKENFPEYSEHCNNYGPHFPYAYVGNELNGNSKDSGYQIQRTNPGEYYKWHHDGWIENKFIRLVTYIWYLNDIKEDGYTEFSNGMKIQPEEGKLLIFPATWTYVHQGYPPKSETKYICTGWISYEIVR
jgi:hypothetical protein